MQRPTWWQAGFVQLISRLSVAAYKQSTATYLMPCAPPDSRNPTVRSNRVIPLRCKTQ